jgi:hypothetical protein
MANYLFENQTGKKFYYKGIIRNELKMSGIPFMDTIDKYEFTVTFLKRKYNMCELYFNLEYIDLFIGFEPMKEFVDSFEQMMNIYQHLHLELGQFVMMDTVKNMQEIGGRWEDYKEKLFKDKSLGKIPDEKKKEMVATGNKEYYSNKRICKSINSHILYKTFFMPLFNDISQTNGSENAEDYSNLFAANPEKRIKIPLVTSNLLKKNKDSDLYRLEINTTLDKGRLDEKILLNALKEQYPSLRQRLARYSWESNFKYNFSPDTGIIDNYEYTYFEQINDDLESNNFCKMELIKEKSDV